MHDPKTLPASSPLAIELRDILDRGDVAALRRRVEEHPGISSAKYAFLGQAPSFSWMPTATWEGFFTSMRTLQGIVHIRSRSSRRSSATVRTSMLLSSGQATKALHCTALGGDNDDVELIDALLDAGADIERPGSSIDGRPPLQSATGYGQMQAVRKLVERGAVYFVWHAAALGMMTELAELIADKPSSDDLSGALWQAANNGQLAAAKLLVEHGADVNWRAPWSDETPFDVARANGQNEVASWLLENGAVPGATTPEHQPDERP